VYKRVVFVDFENLQKVKAKYLTADTKLVVLCGINQDKTVFDFCKGAYWQPCTMEFIKPNVQGKNALDFCVVFYVGLNLGIYSDAQIVIYANDKDYDPLIRHLKEIGMNIVKEGYEETEYSEPVVTKQKKTTNDVTNTTKIKKVYDAAIGHFRKTKQKKSNPRKIKTLKTYLKTALNQKYSDEIIGQVVDLMIKNEVVFRGTGDNIKFNQEKLK
jgi:hypothetical protein